MKDSIAKLLEVGSAEQCVTFLQCCNEYAMGSLRERHMYYALINALNRIAKLEKLVAGPMVEVVRATDDPTSKVIGGVFK